MTLVLALAALAIALVALWRTRLFTAELDHWTRYVIKNGDAIDRGRDA